MHVLLTGAAGFIGFHCCKALLDQGYKVIGVDNLDDYYDVSLKKARLAQLEHENFTFLHLNITDRSSQDLLEEKAKDVEYIVHLAAQAGVRYSLENPYVYADTNVMGHVTMLECARRLQKQLKKFVFSSTSSVYGANTKLPFSVEDRTDTPLAIYAATKKCGELMSHAYSHLFDIPVIALRFFTVYGPWGRPDMAAFLFTKAILAGEKINVFNNGDMRRNFTYVGDIVQGVLGAINSEIHGLPRYKIYNIGNNQSESLMDFITILEDKLGITANMNMMPMQAGDVKETIADISESTRDLGFKPQTSLKEGLGHFVDWYREYYNV